MLPHSTQEIIPTKEGSFESQFEDTDHHGSAGMVAGLCHSQSYYIHSHEAEAVGQERKWGGRERRGEERMLGLHPLEWVLPIYNMGLPIYLT